jgi:hypothetical protein
LVLEGIATRVTVTPGSLRFECTILKTPVPFIVRCLHAAFHNRHRDGRRIGIAYFSYKLGAIDRPRGWQDKCFT